MEWHENVNEECGLYVNIDGFLDVLLCKIEMQTCFLNGKCDIELISNQHIIYQMYETQMGIICNHNALDILIL